MEQYNILVVDDDQEIVRSLGKLLELEGYRVLTAYNGMEALDRLETDTVHLILLDVMMPQLGGLSALMKIRKKHNIPVIILSAKTEESDKVSGRPVKVLNLFAYTGGATLAAAAAGAAVTHVDASKGMVTWAKENAVSSGLKDAPIRWLVDDCTKFVEREIRRGNHYDAIIMDPPSYGRGPKGEIWKIEDSIHPFIKLCTKLLSDQPLFFLVNSYTTGLAPAVLTYMLSTELKDFGGHVESQEIALPVTSSGLFLPCGASGRWEV